MLLVVLGSKPISTFFGLVLCLSLKNQPSLSASEQLYVRDWNFIPSFETVALFLGKVWILNWSKSAVFNVPDLFSIPHRHKSFGVRGKLSGIPSSASYFLITCMLCL